ncbi:hypothetical protein Syun_028238 [Stephania yunnanensis]|uniref:Uncharacterized protein n=1 Tax=Stephania yunnanensis TaxID=152371 RepID=A0AAP0HQN4_9MAGN
MAFAMRLKWLPLTREHTGIGGHPAPPVSGQGMWVLEYPEVGPQHSLLKDIGRAEYYSIIDEEALEAASSETNARTLLGCMLLCDVYPQASIRKPYS